MTQLVRHIQPLPSAHQAQIGYEAMMAMGNLEGFKVYAVHDCWTGYFRFAILHALCSPHLLRELINAMNSIIKHGPRS